MHSLLLFHVQTDRVGGKQYFLDGCKNVQWGRVVDENQPCLFKAYVLKYSLAI